MEITNIFDFESKIDFLTAMYSEDITKDIQNQNEYMNSNIINNNFEVIENRMNILYERMRNMEEIIGYAKLYVNSEIDKVITECRGILNEIENMNDLKFNEEKNFTILNVPLVNNDVAQYADRDGSMLNTCVIYNNAISLSGSVKDTTAVTSISVDSTAQVYERNRDDLLKQESYRSHYFLDEPAKNGVCETITFNFKAPKSVNSIKAKLSNCSIENIIYIHENNTETHCNAGASLVMPNKTVKAIKLLIKSTNYSTKKVSVTTTQSNSFEALKTAWKSIYNNVKDYDDASTKSSYESKMIDYLEDIYIKGNV